MLKFIILFFVFLFFTACNKTVEPKKPTNETNLTVGIVQKEIKIGMTQTEVATVMGSPNIVSSTEKNKETWIYDKFTSNVSYKQNNQYGTILLLSSSSNDGNINSSQKTLTVIIKFKNGVINDFKYHTSRF